MTQHQDENRSSLDEGEDDSDEEPLDPNFEIKTVVTLPRPNDPKHPFDILDLATRVWFRKLIRSRSNNCTTYNHD